MLNSREMYDLSNYPATHPKYKADFALNRAKVGLMKDEAAGSIITEFFGLRPKMYSFVIAQSKADGTVETVNKHRAKGIQRAAADKFIHQQYKAQLEHPEENYVPTAESDRVFTASTASRYSSHPCHDLTLSGIELSLSCHDTLRESHESVPNFV